MRVSVIGGGSVTDEEYAVAKTVGRLLAERGHAVVCGGLGGVMEATCRGTTEAGGRPVSILPGEDRAAANEYVETAVATGLGNARNVLVVLNGDADEVRSERAKPASENPDANGESRERRDSGVRVGWHALGEEGTRLTSTDPWPVSGPTTCRASRPSKPRPGPSLTWRGQSGTSRVAGPWGYGSDSTVTSEAIQPWSLPDSTKT